MFITAKSALIDAGACKRWMPFECTVEYRREPGGEWYAQAKGFSTEYLASSYTDMRTIWPSARIINSATGVEIFRG